MGFIQKIFNFVAHPTSFRTIVVLAVLVIAVPLTVIVAQQQQQIRQRAAEPQSIPSSECSPPYDGYLGCLTENGCNNVGISSQVSCSDENVQQGVYCYESTKQGQTCFANSTNGTCDDQGNCVFSPLTPTETPIPTSAPEVQTVAPTLTLTPAEEIISPTITVAPIEAPTISVSVPTSIQTNTPTNTIIQNTPTPSQISFCYLKNKGDADCDNKITQDDEGIWEQEFVSELSGIPTQKQSDFNVDGSIAIVDFNIWKTGFADPSLPH